MCLSSRCLAVGICHIIFRLCFTSVISNVEYASVVWNSITSAAPNKLERIRQKCAAFCINRFPQVSLLLCCCLRTIKTARLTEGGITLMHCSLLKFTVALNSALPFWRLLVFEFLLNISETKQNKLRGLVRQRTIPTERPPLVGEVSANFTAVNFGFLDRSRYCPFE
jgi:hypothetical protein